MPGPQKTAQLLGSSTNCSILGTSILGACCGPGQASWYLHPCIHEMTESEHGSSFQRFLSTQDTQQIKSRVGCSWPGGKGWGACSLVALTILCPLTPNKGLVLGTSPQEHCLKQQCFGWVSSSASMTGLGRMRLPARVKCIPPTSPCRGPASVHKLSPLGWVAQLPCSR